MGCLFSYCIPEESGDSSPQENEYIASATIFRGAPKEAKRNSRGEMLDHNDIITGEINIFF